ncbi:MAG: hypothetical protein PHU14_06560 [Methylovulum sp.]|nr:hypothetical protein [Methylovulum sp.]
MYTEINAAIQASKTILNIINANKGILKYNELNAAVSEVYSKLNSVQISVSTLLEENQSLKQQIAEMREKELNNETFDGEFSHYKLHEMPSGAFVYKIKPEHYREDCVTYICTDCARNRKISPFNTFFNGAMFVCDDCHKNVKTGWKPGEHKKP